MRQSFPGGPLYAQGYDGGSTTPYMPLYLEHWERLGRPRPLPEPMCGAGLNLVSFLQADAERDELEAELRAAGFDEIRVTRAWAHDAEPGPRDGIVFLLPKDLAQGCVGTLARSRVAFGASRCIMASIRQLL